MTSEVAPLTCRLPRRRRRRRLETRGRPSGQQPHPRSASAGSRAPACLTVPPGSRGSRSTPRSAAALAAIGWAAAVAIQLLSRAGAILGPPVQGVAQWSALEVDVVPVDHRTAAAVAIQIEGRTQWTCRVYGNHVDGPEPSLTLAQRLAAARTSRPLAQAVLPTLTSV